MPIMMKILCFLTRSFLNEEDEGHFLTDNNHHGNIGMLDDEDEDIMLISNIIDSE